MLLAHERVAKAASSFLLLHADVCFRRFHAARVNLCHALYLHRLPLLDALRTGEVERRGRFFLATAALGLTNTKSL